MSSGNHKRKRSERVASLELPPSGFLRTVGMLRSGMVLGRLGLCLLTAFTLWFITAGWEPPFAYREHDILQREVVARVDFQGPNQGEIHKKHAIISEVKAGIPISAEAHQLLRSEHDAVMRKRDVWERIAYAFGSFGMYVAISVLCGFSIYHWQPELLINLRKYSTLLLLFVLAIASSWSLANWKCELTPLVFFGIIASIAYQRELALILSAVVSLVIILSLGQGLATFVVFTATAATAIQLSGKIRSRTKLLHVGLVATLVAMATAMGVGSMAEQPASMELIENAAMYGFCTMLAALVMIGFLPIVERLLDVQTEISLLELGDAAHPLLQELVRRAPGTYNHSINVASIAEAAAESIGVNGLLVRVGAYFHDIGKIFKPGYFVENQGQEDNRHESLMPAMSTIVIIAHVKDGADLARQHHLPQILIDFIEQHHGTTLVEYFYDRAKGKSEENPDSGDVDERTFRYPGPRPRSKEAGVLMLADAVESASRVLVDPAPARIENLVEEMAMKRLLDGQFDECNLTLAELRTVQDSLVKSLIAVYHGRVKYPDQQQTA